ARAAAGHKRKAVARAELAPEVQRDIDEVSVPATAKGVHAPQPPEVSFDFHLEDMPTPRARPAAGAVALSPEAVAAAFSRYNQVVDVSALGQRIREARRRRLNPDPDGPGPDPGGET